VTKSKGGVALAATSALGLVLAVIAVLSWSAGGPQPLHLITQSVALPELTR
jgi:hypothetical protein